MFNFFNKKMTKPLTYRVVEYLQKNPYDIFLGETKDGLHFKKLIQNPGCLFVGSMGSGKSVSAYSSFLMKNLANPNDLIFIVDPLMGGNDYIPLFGRKNVIPLVNDHRYIKAVIDFCIRELRKRRDLFNKKQSLHIEDFNNHHPNSKLSNIFIVFENAHVLTSHLNYDQEEQIPNSSAEKLKVLSRIGRNFGIYLNFVSQQVNPIIFPSSLKVGCSNILAFRCPIRDWTFLNLPHAQEISNDERGKAATDSNLFVQFPYISSTDSKALTHLYPDTPNYSFLEAFSSNTLHEIKLNPDKILNINSKLTMLDQAEVEEDLDFWDFIANGIKISNKKD